MGKTSRLYLRAEDDELERWAAAAKVADVTLSDWIRGLANKASSDTPVAAKAADTMRAFDPAGPAVETVPVKPRKSKKAAASAVIEVEAATVAAPKTAPAPGAPPPAVDRDYTGETSVFNGVLMYEYRLPTGRKTWTKEPPPAS